MRKESAVILMAQNCIDGVKNTYRLIRIEEDETYYSLFLTTDFEGIKDEEYYHKLTTDKRIAQLLFHRIYEGGVTACTLHDVVKDLLSGEFKSKLSYIPLCKRI